MYYKNKLLLKLAIFLTNLFIGTLIVGCVKSNPMASATPQATISVVSPVNYKDNYITLYYITRQGGYLVPINWKIEKAERPARVALEKLIDEQTIGGGLFSPLPTETKIRDLYVNDKIAYVDLNADFLNKIPDGEIRTQQARLAVDAIVQTLTEFPEIERVQILIDGMVYDNVAEGVAIDVPLARRQWLNIVDDDQSSMKVVLYFDYQGEFMVPISRGITDFSKSLSQLAVEELIKGPCTAECLNPVIPVGINLLSYKVEEGTAYVNISLSKETSIDSILKREAKALQSLVFTLNEFPHIHCVQLKVEDRVIGTISESEEATDTKLLPLLNYIE